MRRPRCVAGSLPPGMAAPRQPARSAWSTRDSLSLERLPSTRRFAVPPHMPGAPFLSCACVCPTHVLPARQEDGAGWLPKSPASKGRARGGARRRGAPSGQRMIPSTDRKLAPGSMGVSADRRRSSSLVTSALWSLSGRLAASSPRACALASSRRALAASLAPLIICKDGRPPLSHAMITNCSNHHHFMFESCSEHTAARAHMLGC